MLPALEDFVKGTVSALAGPSAGALRVISTGAQVIGTLHGSQHMVLAGTAGQAVAKFIETAAAAGGAGATTTDSAATAAGQRSNAPTQEDLSSAPAPQLAETTDPVGPNTRPEVPETEDSPGAVQSYLIDPLNSPDHLLQELMTQIGQSQEEWDPEELEAILSQLEDQILNVRKFLVGGSYTDKPLRVKQTSEKLKSGKLVPV